MLTKENINGGTEYPGETFFRYLFFFALGVVALFANVVFGVAFIISCVLMYFVVENHYLSVGIAIVFFVAGMVLFSSVGAPVCLFPGVVALAALLLSSDYVEDYFYEKDSERGRQEFRRKYVNDDLAALERSMEGIGPKIDELNSSNDELRKSIDACISTANEIIEEAYRNVLPDAFFRGAYYRDFDKIQQGYSSKLSPALVDACAESVQRLSAAITRKQEQIDRNNADIDELKGQAERFQRRYEDELALQKIKEISQKVNL